MSCEITSGYTKASCASVGGYKSVTFIPHSGIELTVVSNLVDSYTQTLDAFKFTPDVASGMADENATGSRENNTNIYEQNVMIMLKENSTATIQKRDALCTGYWMAIVEDNNGLYRVYGWKNGLFNGSSTTKTGQALADMAGSTINIASTEQVSAPFISAVDAAAIVSYVS